MTDEKVRLNRLKMMAMRQRLALRKTYRRDPQAPDYGKYFLTDHSRDMIVFGHNGNYVYADLDDIEDALLSGLRDEYGKSSNRHPR